MRFAPRIPKVPENMMRDPPKGCCAKVFTFRLSFLTYSKSLLFLKRGLFKSLSNIDWERVTISMDEDLILSTAGWEGVDGP
jgi:hypothetical protein